MAVEVFDGYHPEWARGVICGDYLQRPWFKWLIPQAGDRGSSVSHQLTYIESARGRVSKVTFACWSGRCKAFIASSLDN